MTETPLETYLREKKESQHDFAARVGISDSALSSWLLGKRAPDIYSAKLIKEATGGAVSIESWARPDKRRRARKTTTRSHRKATKPQTA